MSLSPPSAASPGDRFVGATGQLYTLESLLGRGGEGSTFTLRKQPDRIAKLYHQAPEARHREKLQVLSALKAPALRKVAALPEDVLVDRRGALAGFVMPRVIDAKPLHMLVTPQDRLQHFPHLAYKHLVQIAANVARAMAAAHAAGIVVADVNTSNMLVRPDGTVRLIDCDSVQIGDGRRHRCAVAMEDYLAPELHGRTLANRPRSESHDAFALAIIILQLLLMGRHPHSGAGLPIPDAIRARRHLLERRRSGRPLRDIIGFAPEAVLSRDIIAATRTAFEVRWRTSRRPTPQDWIRLLDRLASELVQCPRNLQHQYRRQSRSCPWCDIEQGMGVALFQSTPVPPAQINARPRSPHWLSASAIARSAKRTWKLVQRIGDAVLPRLIRFYDRHPRISWAIGAWLVWRLLR